MPVHKRNCLGCLPFCGFPAVALLVVVFIASALEAPLSSRSFRIWGFQHLKALRAWFLGVHSSVQRLHESATHSVYDVTTNKDEYFITALTNGTLVQITAGAFGHGTAGLFSTLSFDVWTEWTRVGPPMCLFFE